MGYFNKSAVNDRKSAQIKPTHVKKDVGFGEALQASRKNTYGIAEEGAIKWEAEGKVRDWLLARDDKKRFISPTSPEFTNDVFTAVRKLHSEGIDVPQEFLDPVSFHESALDVEADKFMEREGVLQRSTGLGKAGAILGGVVGSMDDPENLITLPLGASARAGIAMTAMVEGGINAAIEGVGHKPRQDLLKKMGIESEKTLLRSITEGFVGGAVLGGGLRAVTGPEIYRAAGKAINAVGLRKVAKTFQKSDEPIASIQGYAIEDELNYKAQHKSRIESGLGDRVNVSRGGKVTARQDPDSISDDLDFLSAVEANEFDFEFRVQKTISDANDGALPVLINTSDGATQVVEVSSAIARTANLIQRQSEGEAIPLGELEELGVDLDINNTTRRVIEYYDLMDARFRGHEIPDDFDAIEDFDLGPATESDLVNDEILSALSNRVDGIKERKERAKAIEARLSKPENFANNLTRFARDGLAVERELDTIGERIQEDYVGILADVEKITSTTDEGGVKSVKATEIIRELLEDQDFAEQIKLCGLQ